MPRAPPPPPPPRPPALCRDQSLYVPHQRDARARREEDDDLQLDRTAAELQQAVLDLTAEDQVRTPHV